MPCLKFLFLVTCPDGHHLNDQQYCSLGTLSNMSRLLFVNWKWKFIERTGCLDDSVYRLNLCSPSRPRGCSPNYRDHGLHGNTPPKWRGIFYSPETLKSLLLVKTVQKRYDFGPKLSQVMRMKVQQDSQLFSVVSSSAFQVMPTRDLLVFLKACALMTHRWVYRLHPRNLTVVAIIV